MSVAAAAVFSHTATVATQRHSEHVLSERRDAWWNQDYLELVATRLSLDKYQRVLDVGCGHGHWGQRLLPLLGADATLVGVDQERDWIELARGRSRARGLEARSDYQQADAAKLPFADGSFDLVTCQTLLMHVASSTDVLNEMRRVLASGGRLLLAEPSNLPNQFSTDTVQRALPPEDLSAVFYLFVCCSRGRAARGRGDDSIADVLPQQLADLGLHDVQVFQNECAHHVLPPYTDAMAAQLAEEVGYAERGFWLWDRDDAYQLYTAGGGAADRFEAAYAAFLRRSATFRAQVEASTYARTGGGHHYLITARAA